mgnify:CR=1 FL=1
MFATTFSAPMKSSAARAALDVGATANLKPGTSQPASNGRPPTNPHEDSRIWSKFVLYSAPAISLHTRTGH